MIRVAVRAPLSCKRSGISVIELLLALSLLGLTLAAAYGIVTQSSRMLLAARDHYVATTLCLARIELARNVDYALIGLLADPVSGLLVDNNGTPDQEGNYLRETTVLPNVPAPGLTTMTVDVRIKNRLTGTFGRDRETISCIFTRYLLPEDI